jgi:hypothetical protein
MFNLTMDAGSHSILDMQRVSAKPGFGNVVPMTEAEMQQIPGTTKPTVADVEEAKDRPWQRCRRWEGLLVVIHDDAGAPSEISFLGAPGD